MENYIDFSSELLELSHLLAGPADTQIDYNHLTAVLCRISGAAYGVLNIYSEDGTRFRNIALYGESSKVLNLADYLGFSIINKEWNISKVRVKEISCGTPVRFENLIALAKGALSPELCKTISEVFNLGVIYAVEISANNRILGDFLLFFTVDKEIVNPATVMAYANLVGIALDRRRMDERIAKSENNLNKFFNTGNDFNWVLDMQGNIISYNDTVRSRLGYNDEELKGTPIINLHPENLREEARIIIEAMLEGSQIPCFIPVITKSGKQIPVETYVRMGEWDGKPALFGKSRDISDLKLSEEKFAKAFNTSSSIIGLSTLNEGIYVEVNQAFYDILGFTPDEVIGKKSSDILVLNEDYRNKMKKQVIETGSVRNQETIVYTKERKPLVFQLSAEIIQIQGTDMLLTVGRDITENKNSEIVLQYQSDLRKILVELSSEFINLPVTEIGLAINKSLARVGSFVGADRAYIFEYDFTENTVTNTVEWCNEGIMPEIMNLQGLSLDVYPEFVNAHKNGQPYIVEKVEDLPESMFRRLLEDEDILSILTIPLLSNGQCIGFVGFDSVRERHSYNLDEEQLLKVYAQTLVNVMERIEKENKLISAKEKAEESDRLKSAFLANMSHEIRTPMNGIIGFLNLLREPDLSEENKAAYINIVTMSGQRLLDTINDIIEISRIESGELNINYSDINISELTGYHNGFFTQQAEKKGLYLSVNERFPEEIRYFRSDRNKIDSIVSNLMKNAIKFTQAGSVELGCYKENDRLVFYVSDTGIGIPAEKTDRIFERFVQADSSNSRQHEGSGLGLAIVKGYVDLLEGTIQVVSKAGHGTKFTFSIPYLPAETADSTASVNISEDRTLPKGLKILIAEDDYASYLYLHKTLADSAVSIIRTLSGEDTVKCVREDASISIILMDIKLAGMSGLEATRKIREFNTTIPIIAQTAYSLYGDREHALNAGCTDYLSKPVDRLELKRLLVKYTDQKK